MPPDLLIQFAESLLGSSVYLSNLVFWHQSGYFEISAELKPLLHTWSLSLEVQFYLLFAFFMFFVIKSNTPQIKLIFLILLFLNFLFCVFATYSFPGASFFLLPTRVWEFFAGSCAFFVLRDYKIEILKYVVVRRSLAFISLFVLFLVSILINKKTVFPGLIAVVPVFATFVYLAVAEGVGLRNKVLESIGSISYPLYLWHYPILSLQNYLYRDFDKDIIFFAGYMILLVAISYATKLIVEVPFISFAKIKTKLSSLTMVVCSLVLAGLGGTLYFSNGLLFSYPTEISSKLSQYIRASDFVKEKYQKHENKRFSTSSNEKILVIGDSFSQDFFNILVRFNGKIVDNVSTFYRPTKCGGTLGFELTNVEIPSGCSDIEKKENVLSLVDRADIIYFAWSWNNETMKKMIELEKFISGVTRAKLVVIGDKSFNKFDSINYRRDLIGQLEIKTYSKLSANIILSNEFFEEHLIFSDFINFSKFYCDKGLRCTNFDSQGNLLSYDGRHLTRAGVDFMSKKLQYELLN